MLYFLFSQRDHILRKGKSYPNARAVLHLVCFEKRAPNTVHVSEGSFQSDALLVPEGCLFDHIHNQSRCWEFDRWNTTADHACGARRMTLKSFAMLLPCGIDVFSGVEFVCCPKNYKGHGKARPMEVEEPVALPQVDRRAHQPEAANAAAATTTMPKIVTTTPSQVREGEDRCWVGGLREQGGK